jgi:hypothetical protein
MVREQAGGWDCACKPSFMEMCIQIFTNTNKVGVVNPMAVPCTAILQLINNNKKETHCWILSKSLSFYSQILLWAKCFVKFSLFFFLFISLFCTTFTFFNFCFFLFLFLFLFFFICVCVCVFFFSFFFFSFFYSFFSLYISMLFLFLFYLPLF